ncbi:hypothetical protein CASFOL_041388 [Castilleja foliolosa]|uniref:non-specific serine/threonine protein kinase n=1 Tax=Castilleja foliolosa TaxID=1961234 RepID=A0ABD3BEM6_9LAMI
MLFMVVVYMSRMSCCDAGSESPNYVGGDYVEFRRSHHQSNEEFKLKGRKIDDDSIYFTLHIDDRAGRVRNLHFPFYLEVDKASDVAAELVDALELASHDVAIIVDLIEGLIMRIFPDSADNCCCESGLTMLTDQWQTALSANTSCGSAASSDYPSIKNDIFKGSSGEDSEMEYKMNTVENGHLECVSDQVSKAGIFKTSFSALSSSLKTDPESTMEYEINAIEKLYEQWFQELSRVKQEAIEATKMKWMTNK